MKSTDIKRSERNRRYREKTKEQRRLYDAARYACEKETILAHNREYRRQNPTKIAELSKQWHQANMHKVRIYRKATKARRRGAIGSFSFSEWCFLKARFGYMCLRCKISEAELAIREKVAERHLTPDHVIPISKGGSNLISNIQPLCLLCNQRNYWDNLNGVQVDYRLEKLSWV